MAEQTLRSFLLPVLGDLQSLYALYNGYLPPSVRPYTSHILGATFVAGNVALQAFLSRKRKRIENHSADESKKKKSKKTAALGAQVDQDPKVEPCKDAAGVGKDEAEAPKSTASARNEPKPAQPEEAALVKKSSPAAEKTDVAKLAPSAADGIAKEAVGVTSDEAEAVTKSAAVLSFENKFKELVKSRPSSVLEHSGAERAPLRGDFMMQVQRKRKDFASVLEEAKRVEAQNVQSIQAREEVEGKVANDRVYKFLLGRSTVAENQQEKRMGFAVSTTTDAIPAKTCAPSGTLSTCLFGRKLGESPRNGESMERERESCNSSTLPASSGEREAPNSTDKPTKRPLFREFMRLDAVPRNSGFRVNEVEASATSTCESETDSDRAENSDNERSQQNAQEDGYFGLYEDEDSNEGRSDKVESEDDKGESDDDEGESDNEVEEIGSEDGDSVDVIDVTSETASVQGEIESKPSPVRLSWAPRNSASSSSSAFVKPRPDTPVSVDLAEVPGLATSAPSYMPYWESVAGRVGSSSSMKDGEEDIEESSNNLAEKYDLQQSAQELADFYKIVGGKNADVVKARKLILAFGSIPRLASALMKKYKCVPQGWAEHIRADHQSPLGEEADGYSNEKHIGDCTSVFEMGRGT